MPTLPGPLRVNNYAASFPASGRLPAKPNPLSSVTPVAGGKADMQGIEQALVKRAQQFAKVGPGAGRRFQGGLLKLADGLGLLGRAEQGNKLFDGLEAWDATKVLQKTNKILDSVVDRAGNFSPAHVVLGREGGNLFTDNKAWLLPLLLGGAGAAAQGGVGATIGGIGLPLSYMAMQSPQLMNSMRGVFGRDKVPLPGGVPPPGGALPPGGAPPALSLNTPSTAPTVKVGFQDNKAVRQSAAGEGKGVGYVVNEDNHLTGTKAFGTLDKYMKKAGLNSFQSQFFGRLILEGCTPARRDLLLKHAGARFGNSVAAELAAGLRKLAVFASSEKRSSAMPNLRDPLTASLSGAAVGGLGGGLQGLMDPGYDERGRKRERMNAMLSSGLIGAGLGGAAGGLGSLGYNYFSPEKPKLPSLEDIYKGVDAISTSPTGVSLRDSWNKAVAGDSDAARAFRKLPEESTAPAADKSWLNLFGGTGQKVPAPEVLPSSTVLPEKPTTPEDTPKPTPAGNNRPLSMGPPAGTKIPLPIKDPEVSAGQPNLTAPTAEAQAKLMANTRKELENQQPGEIQWPARSEEEQSATDKAEALEAATPRKQSPPPAISPAGIPDLEQAARLQLAQDIAKEVDRQRVDQNRLISGLPPLSDDKKKLPRPDPWASVPKSLDPGAKANWRMTPKGPSFIPGRPRETSDLQIKEWQQYLARPREYKSLPMDDQGRIIYPEGEPFVPRPYRDFLVPKKEPGKEQPQVGGEGL